MPRSYQTLDLEDEALSLPVSQAYLVYCFQLSRGLGLELGGRATVLAAEA